MYAYLFARGFLNVFGYRKVVEIIGGQRRNQTAAAAEHQERNLTCT